MKKIKDMCSVYNGDILIVTRERLYDLRDRCIKVKGDPNDTRSYHEGYEDGIRDFINFWLGANGTTPASNFLWFGREEPKS